MFIYSNTQMIQGTPVAHGGITIDGENYGFVKNAVWDTENQYGDFRYPILYITALPSKKECDENREEYCEFGINEFSAERAIVYRFSPRDMLATLDYLESEAPDSLPEDDDQKQRFCEHFANVALIETGASKPIQGAMYWLVVGFFCEVHRRYTQSQN